MFKLLFTNDFSIDNTSKKEMYINRLENSIIKYNSELLKGVTIVDDATYTNCVELLNMLHPSSPILKNDKDVIFIKSLNADTVELLSDKLKDMDVLQFYLNPQGFNVRLIYDRGELVEAYTYGRSFKRRDVLDLMIRIMSDRNDNLSDLGRIEIDGVIVLAYDNIDMVKDFCVVKDAYTGIFSLLSYDSYHEGEIEDLETMLYFIATDINIEGFPFETVNQKYEMLENYGFMIPSFFDIEKTNNLALDIEDALYQAETRKSMYEYMTDGLRLLMPNNDVILLKIGSWEITSFEGIVEKISWKDEEGKKVPILHFKESVKIFDDLEISDIVLKNINLLLILNIEIGEPIRFAYFGDMGILPITENQDIILN